MTSESESSFTVLPLYGQVFIGDGGQDTEYPQFETGEEAVVTSASAVVVATQSDSDGPVHIRVRELEKASIADEAEGTVVFDGELLLPSGQLLVGNQLAQQFRTFAVPQSARVQVAVDQPGLASRISVAIGEEAAP